MEAADKVKELQAAYAGALADCVLRMGREGVLGKITAEKKEELKQQGAIRARQMGASTVGDAILKPAEIFGCANWTVDELENGQGYHAIATSCMLCAMAKRMGAQCPCNIYCLDPMEGMAKGIDGNIDFTVNSTLWNSQQCNVDITKKAD